MPRCPHVDVPAGHPQRRYECFFIIADLHLLTTKNARDDITAVTRNARDMVLDALAAVRRFCRSAEEGHGHVHRPKPRPGRRARHGGGEPGIRDHEVFNSDRVQVADLKARYREGTVGDVEVKERLATALNAFLDPIRERRARYQADPGRVDELIVTGTERTRREVRQTVFDARNAMGLTGVYTRIRRNAERAARRRPADAT